MPERTQATGRRGLLAGLLAAAFVAALWPVLADVAHNFDEGLYIYQARDVLMGCVPYRDFFYHQTPLYLYALAAVGWVAPDSIFLYRFVSLVSTALAGVAVYALARRELPEPVSLLAAVLFYTAPLQVWGLVALPNALMLALATAGVALAWIPEGRRWHVLGGALLATSVLVKPLSLPTGLAAGIALLASRERRGRALPVLAGGAATGLAALGVFQVASDGHFTDLLELQLFRYSSESGFEVLRSYPPFRAQLEQLGIDDATAWNVHEHLRAFVRGHHHPPNRWLLALAAAGQVLLLTPLGRRHAGWRLLLPLWWALPLAFSIFVWEPVFDHYFVQYLPPLALLAALPLAALFELRAGGRPGRALARATALAVAAFLASRGANYLGLRLRDYAPLVREATPGETWLTWDPFLNLVTRTRPACGIVDWTNVYGDTSLTARHGSGPWGRFQVSPAELVACLEADPSIRIGRDGSWSKYLIDPELAAWLERQPPERFVSLQGF